MERTDFSRKFFLGLGIPVYQVTFEVAPKCVFLFQVSASH